MTWLLTLAISIVLFQFVFVLAIIKKNNSVVDVFWGLSFVLHSWLIALCLHKNNNEIVPIKFILLGLVSVWGLRLFYHLYKRNAGKEEDWRYRNWREEWGKWFYIRSWLQIFVLQAVLQWIIALPTTFVLIQDPLNVWGVFVIIGLLLWIGGFAIEVIADKQLKEFIKTKKSGDVMTDGVWAYSRHPNYFGEATLWWGIWLVSLGLTGGESWWTIVGPLTITILVRFVSGVPMLEKKYQGNEQFEKYKKNVPIFFPKLTK